MDPNPGTLPVLSYVVSKLPQHAADTGSLRIDIEAPLQTERSDSMDGKKVLDHMPRLKDPKVLASTTRAISEVSQTRSVLQMLGERPDHESVDAAKAKIVEIEKKLSNQLEEIVLSPRPTGADRFEWRAHLAQKENDTREAAEKEKRMCKAVIQLDEMHEEYAKLLRDAEEKLVKVYESAAASSDGGGAKEEVSAAKEEVNEDVVRLLQKAVGNVLERVDLSGRRLKYMPEAFGRIRGLAVLNLSSNQLEVIPGSIAGLANLEELNLSSNLLESLPNSIGLLHNLKILNVSANKLNALPDSICQCRSLVELDAGFNNLTYLATNIGHELVNLKTLSIQYNKIRTLPSSISEMRSLRHLDVHFNELHGLPDAIARLTNLETLNLSSNFSDFKELPDTIGDLTNLKELDLSNNQLRALPDTFGRLDNLIKLNLDQNPIVIPPLEVVKEGVEAVKLFMAKRWLDILVEEERKSMVEMQEDTQTGWLNRGSSWLNNVVAGVSGKISGYVRGGRLVRDPLLDQQL